MDKKGDNAKQRNVTFLSSLRTKILFSALLGILISVLSVSIAGISIMHIESDKDSVSQMDLLADNTKEKIDSYFSSVRQSVDMGIHVSADTLEGVDPHIFDEEKTAEKQEALDQFIVYHCDCIEDAFRNIAENTNGITTYYYCINSELGSNEHGFFFAKENSGEFVRQPDLISTDLNPLDLDHTAWYYSPIYAKKPVWIGPYTAHYLGEQWTISYCAPIFYKNPADPNASEVLIGVMGMDILFATITDQIKAIKIYDNGFVCLVDEEGVVVYHPAMPKGSIHYVVNKAEMSELFHAESSKGRLIRYYSKGQERQLSFTTLIDGMNVVVVAPVSEITFSARQMLIIFAVTAVAVMVVFGLLIYFLVSRIIKPLLKLTEASSKLSEGKYDVELDYDGHDEVGQLTGAFRQMRDHLELLIGDLNNQAYEDALTGAQNRAAFLIAASKLDDKIYGGEKQEFAIVLFDCNDLKGINDTYGHERGDIYLRNAYEVIAASYPGCIVYRIGGDEFVIVLSGDDFVNREDLWAEFKKRTRAHNEATENAWEKVDIARGMSEFVYRSDLKVETVLKRADERMYEDKRNQKLRRK